MVVEIATRDAKTGLLKRDGILYPHVKSGKAMTAAERELHNLRKSGIDGAMVDPQSGHVLETV